MADAALRRLLSAGQMMRQNVISARLRSLDSAASISPIPGTAKSKASRTFRPISARLSLSSISPFGSWLGSPF
jgi:hypothetical protein